MYSYYPAYKRVAAKKHCGGKVIPGIIVEVEVGRRGKKVYPAAVK